MLYTVKVNNNTSTPKKSLYARAMEKVLRSVFTFRNHKSTQDSVINPCFQDDHDSLDELLGDSMETLDMEEMSFPQVPISKSILLQAPPAPKTDDMFQDLVQELATLDSVASLADESDNIEPLAVDIVADDDKEDSKV